MKHAQAARAHAKRRAKERVGVIVNRAQLDAIIATIRAGKARAIWKQTNSRTWFLVTLESEWELYQAVAVYHNKTHTIHTFLTCEQAKITLDAHGLGHLLDRLVSVR